MDPRDRQRRGGHHRGRDPGDILADYLACYDGDRFAESMRCVPRYPEELPVLAGLLPQITVPVTITNGRHDRVVGRVQRASDRVCRRHESAHQV